MSKGLPLTQGLVQFGIWTTAIVLSLIRVGITLALWGSYHSLTPEEKAKKDREHKELTDSVGVADAISPPPGTDWIFFPFIALILVISGTTGITHTLHALRPEITTPLKPASG